MTLKIDDAGRKNFMARDKSVRFGVKVDDCSTRAMVAATKGYGKPVSYGTVCKDVIADKQRFFKRAAQRPPGCENSNWLNTNAATPAATRGRLMRKYTGQAWVEVNIRKELGKNASFQKMATILKPLKSVMLVSMNHIVGLCNGVIRDDFDSQKCMALNVFCSKADAMKVKRLLQKAR